MPDTTPRHPTPAQIVHAEKHGHTAPPRLALRPREAAVALGIGERLLWSLTNRGDIPHVKLGRCTVYPVASLEKMLIEQSAGDRRLDSL